IWRKRLTPFPPKGIRFALRLGTAGGPCDARSAQSVFPTYTPPEKRHHFFRAVRGANSARLLTRWETTDTSHLERKVITMAMEYSEKVMEHFAHPHNVGVIEDANGVGEVGNAKCGDIMRMYLKINDDGIIEDVKFQTFGCASAIATSSIATDMIKGKPVEEALTLTNKAVVEALDGLPAVKIHCSV